MMLPFECPKHGVQYRHTYQYPGMKAICSEMDYVADGMRFPCQVEMAQIDPLEQFFKEYDAYISFDEATRASYERHPSVRNTATDIF